MREERKNNFQFSIALIVTNLLQYPRTIAKNIFTSFSLADIYLRKEKLNMNAINNLGLATPVSFGHAPKLKPKASGHVHHHGHVQSVGKSSFPKSVKLPDGMTKDEFIKYYKNKKIKQIVHNFGTYGFAGMAVSSFASLRPLFGMIYAALSILCFYCSQDHKNEDFISKYRDTYNQLAK